MTKDLCVECYEKEAPSEYFAHKHDFSEAIRTGKCTYCGAPASAGWSSGGMMPGLAEPEWESHGFWCDECGKDLKEFNELLEQQEAMNADINVEDEEAIDRAAHDCERRKAAEREFMRLKILKRRDVGDGTNPS